MSTTTATAQVLINGTWRDAKSVDVFHATDSTNRTPLEQEFPVSSWEDCDAALDAAVEAANEIRRLPRETIAAFLETYAERIEAAKDQLVEAAERETALPPKPRLADVELPRTVNQLRLAAEAARNGGWAAPVIDSRANIRCCFEPIGPVCVFGPNNFPFAFNSVAGGDFAAAIAAGNPVIGKANTTQPETTRLFAVEALEAAKATGMPAATVQLLYRTRHEDGERLVSDPRVGATGYTGSRNAGLKLKAAADKAGKPIYLELSSINPVVILPGALQERSDEIVDEFITSVLMGTGQFCTNPGLVVLQEGEASEKFIAAVKDRFAAAKAGTLLGPSVASSLADAIKTLTAAGAELLTGGGEPEADRCAVANTLLRASADQFLSDPETFQTEAFGNASLIVVAKNVEKIAQLCAALEGNLTGCLYSAKDGSDDAAYDEVAFALSPRVGRMLNDKMPTGVAVSPAMNHGGPFPATGHPGFTAVGIPTAIHRFAKLTSYDNIRTERLPDLLRDKNPTGKTPRYIDGEWTTGDVAG